MTKMHSRRVCDRVAPALWGLPAHHSSCCVARQNPTPSTRTSVRRGVPPSFSEVDQKVRPGARGLQWANACGASGGKCGKKTRKGV